MLRQYDWAIDAGAAGDTELAVNVVSFGDGYEQVSSFGINNAREVWQLSTTAYKDEIDSAYNFLVSHKGVEPFLLDLCGEVKQYRTEGAINRTQLSGNVWSINFTVKQVF